MIFVDEYPNDKFSCDEANLSSFVFHSFNQYVTSEHVLHFMRLANLI